MNESVKESLKMRGDNISLYAAKRIEELEDQVIKSAVTEWVTASEKLPPPLQTVWGSNGKGWTALVCLVETNEGWHWAESNGVIYEENGKIVSECESDDLDVKFWHMLPEPPCFYRNISKSCFERLAL